MKRIHFIPILLCLAALLFSAESAPAQAMRIQAQLVWATNDPRSPDPRHRVINDPELVRRFARAPYRWKNYFEVNRQVIPIAVGETRMVKMSDQCQLEFKNVGGERPEIRLFGNGKLVSKHVQPLAGGRVLVLGGDAKNETGWMVVIKKAEPERK